MPHLPVAGVLMLHRIFLQTIQGKLYLEKKNAREIKISFDGKANPIHTLKMVIFLYI